MTALIAVAVFAAAAEPKRERFEHADVIYERVNDRAGHQLRTFVTRPRDATGKVPVIFFVGWLSCDSMEYPDGDTDGFGAFMRRLIERSGFATVRTDKAGVGESQGDCARTDFETELSGFQAAFDAMGRHEFIDLTRVFVVGLSNGGGFAPLVARGKPVRGYVAAGSWGRTWYEHMLEEERVRLEHEKKSAAEVNTSVKALTELYQLFLIGGRTPGAVLARHPEWKPLWTDSPDGQYGRPAAFYQQLQKLNLGAVWQDVGAPVLVVRGDADTIMSRADSEAIAGIVNRIHPGNATYVEVPGMTHLLTVQGNSTSQRRGRFSTGFSGGAESESRPPKVSAHVSVRS
jgi:pimeloyl-ACP methyl ester carboxylesterase